MGGFIGTLVALLRNMLRTGIKDSGQIENELDLPVYANRTSFSNSRKPHQNFKEKKSIPILAVKMVMTSQLRAYVVSVPRFTLH